MGKKKIMETKARLMHNTMVQAGKYVADKTKAAAIKFAVEDIVSKEIKGASKELMKSEDKVAQLKKADAAKKVKHEVRSMIKAAVVTTKTKSDEEPVSATKKKLQTPHSTSNAATSSNNKVMAF